MNQDFVVKDKFWSIIFFLIIGIGIILSLLIIYISNRTTVKIKTPLDGSVNLYTADEYYLFPQGINNIESLTIRRKYQPDLIFKPRDIYDSHDVNNWTLTSPIIENLDSRKVTDYVTRLLTIYQDEFVDGLNQKDNFKKYGFNNPYMIVTAKIKKGTKFQKYTSNYNAQMLIADDSTYVNFLIGDKVEKNDPFYKNARYVYSSEYQKVGILSNGLDYLEKIDSYFIKNQEILNQTEKIEDIIVDDLYSNKILKLSVDSDNNWQYYNADLEEISKLVDINGELEQKIAEYKKNVRENNETWEKYRNKDGIDTLFTNNKEHVSIIERFNLLQKHQSMVLNEFSFQKKDLKFNKYAQRDLNLYLKEIVSSLRYFNVQSYYDSYLYGNYPTYSKISSVIIHTDQQEINLSFYLNPINDRIMGRMNDSDYIFEMDEKLYLKIFNLYKLS